MAYGREGQKSSNFADLIDQAPVYDLTRAQARERVDRIVATIEDNFAEAAELARMIAADQKRMWRRQFLNPSVMYRYRPMQVSVDIDVAE